MQKIKIAVLRGGNGNSIEDSISSGANILNNLDKEKFEPIDVWVSSDGIWHNNGLEISLSKILNQVDLVINTLSGIDFFNTQRKLELFSIPYIGPNRFNSFISMNKKISQEIFKQIGIKTPRNFLIEVSDNLEIVYKNIFKKFIQPVYVSPILTLEERGRIQSYGIEEIKKNVGHCFNFGPKVLIEEGLIGRNITCFTIENFRGEDIYTTIEFEKNEKGNLKFPSDITKEQKKQISDFSKLAHRSLSLKDYSKFNFLVSKNDIYIISVEPVPFLNRDSEMLKSLENIGCDTKFFLDGLISKELGFV